MSIRTIKLVKKMDLNSQIIYLIGKAFQHYPPKLEVVEFTGKKVFQNT